MLCNYHHHPSPELVFFFPKKPYLLNNILPTLWCITWKICSCSQGPESAGDGGSNILYSEKTFMVLLLKRLNTAKRLESWKEVGILEP